MRSTCTKTTSFCGTALDSIPNKEATTVAKAFYQHWIMRFGAPTVVLSDSGGEFTPIEDNTLAHLEEEFSRRLHVHATTGPSFR